MSKTQSSKREPLVVRSVVISEKGNVVKVTRLELSKEGKEMLRSESSGIRSKRDRRKDALDSEFQAAPA
ncbi:hypothetical protein [Paracidovorax avenae]|uniref:hypothetical protein n=1 Tax=Paracidovorax avenae TaxID=80867 RepID=UPI0012600EBD|nr:hypothetical protein [Paracidovorax avenae]